MISLLRKAKIIFQEPVVVAATASNKLDIDRTEGGALALETIISIHGDTYVGMFFSWENGVKGSKGRRKRKVG